MSTALSWTRHDASRCVHRGWGAHVAPRSAIACGQQAVAPGHGGTHPSAPDRFGEHLRARPPPARLHPIGQLGHRGAGPALRPGPTRLVREALAHEATFASHEVHSPARLPPPCRRRRRTGAQVREQRPPPHSCSPAIHEALEDSARQAPPPSPSTWETPSGARAGDGGAPRASGRSSTCSAPGPDCVGRTSQFERLYSLSTEDHGPGRRSVDPGPGRRLPVAPRPRLVSRDGPHPWASRRSGRSRTTSVSASGMPARGRAAPRSRTSSRRSSWSHPAGHAQR